MVYGRWSSGYKSGGANSRSLFYSPFNPEVVTMFEVGGQTKLFDNRARLNVAAYTGTYKEHPAGLQRPVFAETDPVTGSPLLSHPADHHGNRRMLQAMVT